VTLFSTEAVKYFWVIITFIQGEWMLHQHMFMHLTPLIARLQHHVQWDIITDDKCFQVLIDSLES